MIRASATYIDLCWFPRRVKTKILKKLVFTASLLDVQHLTDSLNKSASSLVMYLSKALTKIPLEWLKKVTGGSGGV